MKNRDCHKKALRETLEDGGPLVCALAFFVAMFGIAFAVEEWTGNPWAALAAGLSVFVVGLAALVYAQAYRDCVRR